MDDTSSNHAFLPNEIQVLKNNKGVDIFYTAAQSPNDVKTPKLHISEFKGEIPIQNTIEEIDFLLRCPTLILKKRKTFYYPTYASLKNFLTCVRFDENGYINLIHPKLVFSICRIYVKSKGIFQNCRINKVYEGPSSFLSIKNAVSCNVRSKMLYNQLSVKPCKCRACHSDSAPSSTLTYIVGFPICNLCYMTEFDDSLKWFRMKDIKTYFSTHLPDFHQHIFYYWTIIPLQAKLIGLLTVLAKNLHPYTLKECESAGQRFLEYAISYPYHEFDKIAWLAGPLSNRHFTNFNKNTFKHIKELDITQFLFLGFLKFPKRCSYLSKEQIGSNIKSIDSNDNDPLPYPFRMIQMEISQNMQTYKSRWLMSGTTYNVYRCLLKGQYLAIVCTAPDFKPVQEWWIDGDEPFMPKRTKDNKLYIFNADKMPWWRWDKYLAYCRKQECELHAYGSIQRCLSAIHGAFVYLIHTFKVLKEFECMGYAFNVNVSSFELEGIVESNVASIEKTFIESKPSPVFNVYNLFQKHCKVHTIWNTDISFLALMQASNMRPRFQALSMDTINKFYYRPFEEGRKKRRVHAT